jgi:hypothetical protein
MVAGAVAHSALTCQGACPPTFEHISWVVVGSGESPGFEAASAWRDGMFERGKGDRAEGPAAVEITLEGGQKLRGKLVVPPGRVLTELLNGSSAFVEFQPVDGERMFIAKTALQCVQPVHVAAAPKLSIANEDGKPFDPSAILGVAPGASREEVHEAYLKQAKMYHPDRYASAELPPEVRDYLAAMARRVNAAHDALESAQKRTTKREEPVFTKAGHGQ